MPYYIIARLTRWGGLAGFLYGVYQLYLVLAKFARYKSAAQFMAGAQVTAMPDPLLRDGAVALAIVFVSMAVFWYGTRTNTVKVPKQSHDS
ncbi:hypothetical protein ACFQH6_03750 [Halobacteriaceae archaeon GCM10025711]